MAKMHVCEEDGLDYSVLEECLTRRDCEVTEERGLCSHQEWEEELRSEVKHYNQQNGTNFNDWEAFHQYLEFKDPLIKSS